MQALAVAFAVTVAVSFAAVAVAIPSFLQFMIWIVDEE
jgi:hypothetical protein